MPTPDTRTEAEKLREAVAQFTKSRAVSVNVLRAVVETLGLEWKMLDASEWCGGPEDMAEGLAQALATLLTAAEVPND